MVKAVFDTNIFVSAAIATGPCNKLLQAAEKRKFTLFISEEILREVEETLHDPEFRFNPRQIRIYLRKIRNIVKV
ncbi:MAG: putative toxin-antitoxin system toxin component, PIN family, partial [Nanoarchaeota archaeon]|nr:putative toxin-antitoxin system toxin component, PIN family [Nanoarchaeota archaeon]